MKIPPYLALAGLFYGCAKDTRLGTIDARYQVPSLPLHFRTPKDGMALSLAASANDQGTVRHERTYRERSDGTSLFPSRAESNTHPYAEVRERYALERAPYAISASLVGQEEEMYAGVVAGLDPENAEAYHAGGFAGLSGGFGPWTLSAAAGLFRNRMRKEVHYWNYSDLRFLDTLLIAGPREDSVYVPDTLSRWTVDWEVRFAAGVRYQVSPAWAPYLSAELGKVRFWHTPAEGTDDRWVGDLTFGAGLEWRPAGSFPIRAEARLGRVLTGEGDKGMFLTSGLRLEKEW